MNMFNNFLDYLKNERKIDYLIILILGLTTVFWFKHDLVYIGGDQIIPLNPITGLKYLYLWNSDNTGSVSWGFNIYFFVIFYAFFYKLGLGVSTIQLLFFYFVRVLSGLAMYHLFSNISKENQRLGGVIAAMFYMFNPSLLYFSVNLPYAVMPALISFFNVALKSESTKTKIKYALFTSIISFGLMNDLPNYKMVFITIFICILIVLFYYNFNIFNKIKTIVLFCSIFFLINMPALISFFYLVYGRTTQIIQAASLPEKFGDLGTTVMFQVFRLSGPGIGGFGQVYKESFFIMITYAFAIIALSAPILKPKSKNVILFSFLACIGLLLNTGPNLPFAPIFKFLLYNVDILRAFRTVGTVSIITTIAYSILIGITASTIYNSKQINKNVGRLIVIVIAIIILASVYPLVTGSIHDSEYASYSQIGKKIPESYYKINTVIENDNTDFKVLVFPPNSGYQAAQWDKYYYGPIIYSSIITKPTLNDPTINYGDVQKSRILSEIYNNSLQKEGDIYKVASLNIKYILFDGYSCSFPVDCPKKLYSIPGFQKIQSIDKLDLYKINDTYFTPHIYATDNITILDTNTTRTETSVTFIKIDPTKYRVKVKTNEPFFLVFSETYNVGWKAYFGETNWIEALVKKPISEDNHSIAMGYANTWFIENKGDYEITLYFLPQITVFAGFAISIITFFILIIYLIIKKD